MTDKLKSRIIGLGSYLPKKILTNRDLEQMVETNDEWIVSRTGMKERRIASDEETTSFMGLQAARQALKQADVAPSEIDLVLVATMTGDYICPSTACLIQSELGAEKAAAMDVYAACTGFLYGLSQAKAYIESGMYRTVLLVASEKVSAFIDYQDRNTCVLFGDGAAAAVISGRGAGLSVDTINLGSDGSLGDLIMIPAGGSKNPATKESVEAREHFLKMSGKEVFKHAVRRMGAAATKCIQDAGLKEEQISWLVPHQANVRIIDAMAKHVSFSSDRVFKTVHKYGNTSASSVAIALNELMENTQIPDGEHILLVAFGGGLTWGAAVLTKQGDDS